MGLFHITLITLVDLTTYGLKYLIPLTEKKKKSVQRQNSMEFKIGENKQTRIGGFKNIQSSFYKSFRFIIKDKEFQGSED